VWELLAPNLVLSQQKICSQHRQLAATKRPVHNVYRQDAPLQIVFSFTKMRYSVQEIEMLKHGTSLWWPTRQTSLYMSFLALKLNGIQVFSAKKYRCFFAFINICITSLFKKN
jgi:hypothetical protein